MIPLARPDITQREIDSVVQTMNTGILSIGKKVIEFENKVKKYTGTKYAIAVNSGTSALHLIIKAMSIGDGDEVITTPFSFVASANCIMFENAVPIFTDIDSETFQMDITKIKEKITSRTKAILAVDVFGQPIDMLSIVKIANEFNLKTIEDSCEAIGSEYNHIKAGKMSDAGVFAFYPNKQITTGEGGIIVTDDERIMQLAKSMRNQGRTSGGLWLKHEYLGYNYRLSELHSSIGCVQMDRLDYIINKRETIANIYIQKLRNLKGVNFQKILPSVNKMSWFVFVIKLDENIDRDKVMMYLHDNKIGCRPYFSPIHLQPYMIKEFGYKVGDFPICEQVAKSTIALPFYNNITNEDIDIVVHKLKEGIKKYG